MVGSQGYTKGEPEGATENAKRFFKRNTRSCPVRARGTKRRCTTFDAGRRNARAGDFCRSSGLPDAALLFGGPAAPPAARPSSAAGCAAGRAKPRAKPAIYCTRADSARGCAACEAGFSALSGPSRAVLLLEGVQGWLEHNLQLRSEHCKALGNHGLAERGEAIFVAPHLCSF